MGVVMLVTSWGRLRAESDLYEILSEFLKGSARIVLDGERYELAGSDEVPGYEDEEWAILLRRVNDGRIFEVFIEVTMYDVTDTTVE
jgi:hypothetical protein